MFSLCGLSFLAAITYTWDMHRLYCAIQSLGLSPSKCTETRLREKSLVTYCDQFHWCSRMEDFKRILHVIPCSTFAVPSSTLYYLVSILTILVRKIILLQYFKKKPLDIQNPVVAINQMIKNMTYKTNKTMLGILKMFAYC